jgi:hypothetical protein
MAGLTPIYVIFDCLILIDKSHTLVMAQLYQKRVLPAKVL